MSYNQEDCGCGNTNNLSILNNNLLPNNDVYVNGVGQNSNINQPNNQVLNNPVNNQVLKKSDNQENKSRDINLFLCVLAALAVNESAKYFINKSIRLNSGTSSRYIYYAVSCMGVVILYNII